MAEKKILIDNKAVAKSDTKVTFGIPTGPTPTWAKNMFRIAFALTTAAVAYIAATNLIEENIKYELTLLLKVVVDPLMYVLSKCFNVEEID